MTASSTTTADQSAANETLGFSQRVGNHIANTQEHELGDPLFAHARVALMDWIAVAIAAKEEPLVQKLLAHTELLGGNPQAAVIGHSRQLSVTQAALVNGSMSHALDYDDTLGAFLGHPSVTLFPALLALAELRGIPAKRVMSSYLVGLHTGCWIVHYLGVSHYAKGWHGTSTIGRQGAAAACAHLLGLNAEQTTYALGIAGTLAAGSKQSFGSMCKPFHAGTAAEIGINAALLAESGFDSAIDIYEGNLGLRALMSDGDGTEAGPDFLGDKHPVELLAHKFHAACHCTHAPIDIVLNTAREKTLSVDDIEKIEVYCSQISLDNANKTAPRNGLDAKFSINYSVANALITGKTGMAGYTDDMVNTGEVQALMTRINSQVDDEHREAGLKTTCEIYLRNGEKIRQSMDPLHELPALEIKQERIAAKFHDLCSPILGEERTQKLEQLINNIETLDDIKQLIACTQVDS